MRFEIRPARGIVLSLLWIGCVAGARGAITGQWDFENGTLAAGVGTSLQFRGDTAATAQFGTTTALGVAGINGQVANVLRLPACSPTQGLLLPHGAQPNSGGEFVNRYTLVLDVLFPAGSTGFRALLQTETNTTTTTDAELFVNGGHGIGIGGQYQGNVSPGEWHRLAFTVDLSKRELGKYVDGTNVLNGPVGAAPLGTNPVQYLEATAGAIDGRWSLQPVALLFADEDNETGVLYINSIQIHDRVLTGEQIAALGRPSATGIPFLNQSGIAQWEFNGSLASATGGSNLVAGFAAPATAPGVAFTTTTIAGQTAQVASFTRGTFFRMTHGLGVNGGGAFLNRYTVVMDVMFPTRPTGWAALWQTGPANANDADWFINPQGGIGIGGNYGGTLADGTWYRLALVVDATTGTYNSYVNGAAVQQNTGVTLDSRFSADGVALLFADEDQENAAGYVNSVQVRPEALTAADVAALGGPAAGGIPTPQPPTLRLLLPNGGEQFQAGTTQTVAWVATNPGGYALLEVYRGDVLYRTIGQTPMVRTNYAWIISPRFGNGSDYRLRLSSASFPAVADFSDAPFTVVDSGPPANPMFGQPLQVNGGFESRLTNWLTIGGNPVAIGAGTGKGAAHSGGLFMYGGLNPGGDSILRQEIDLLAAGFTVEDLDGGAAVDAEAWLRNQYGAGTFDDQVYSRVAFLNEAGLELASVRCLVAGNSVWVPRGLSGLLPSGTRRLRAEIVGRHRRDADNDSMADDVVVRLQEAPAALTPAITKLPMLQDVRTNAMRLLWETDGNLCHHSVEWGRSNVTEHVLTDIETLQIDATHFVHRALLTGLEAETSYVYRVKSGGAVTPPYSFRTAPGRDTPFAVAWWGDNHQGTGILRTHVSNFLAQGVNLIAVAGDMVNSGNAINEWHDYWFKPLEHLNCAQTTPVVFTRGNHDGEHALAYAYSALPGNEAWFAFDYGNSRFIFLDSETPTGETPEQYAWLQAELARPETQRAAFRIVCFHRPPFVNLWNGGGYTGETFVRNDWVPLLAQGNVDVVISGHAHNYNRGLTNGVTYIISGGGGGTIDVERVANWPLFTVEYSRYHYGLMEVNGNTLLWQAFDNNNVLLDMLTLQSRVPEIAIQSPAPGANSIQLTLSGKPGVRYVVEQSTSLASWIAVRTNLLPTGGSGNLTNALSWPNQQQFYRAVIR
jgi:predicted phosphodiesterase